MKCTIEHAEEIRDKIQSILDSIRQLQTMVDRYVVFETMEEIRGRTKIRDAFGMFIPLISLMKIAIKTKNPDVVYGITELAPKKERELLYKEKESRFIRKNWNKVSQEGARNRGKY